MYGATLLDGVSEYVFLAFAAAPPRHNFENQQAHHSAAFLFLQRVAPLI